MFSHNWQRVKHTCKYLIVTRSGKNNFELEITN